MRLTRDWVTPFTMGAFGLLAVTGVLMFFHLDSGLNKVAHEWLSWLLVAGVAAHALVNWPGVRRHLEGWRARLVLGSAAVLLAATFLPVAGRSAPPFVVPMRALADAPVPVLAQVARVPSETIRARLADAGHPMTTDADTVHTLAGNDLGEQMRLLGQVLAAAPDR